MDTLQSDQSMGELTTFFRTEFWLSSKGALFPHSKTKKSPYKKVFVYNKTGQIHL